MSAAPAPGPLPGRLAPDEWWPAGDPAIDVRYLTLSSRLRVRTLACGPANGAPVFLVHGWACSVYVFRRNVHALADAGYRVLTADLCGHGLSDMPEEVSRYSLAALGRHVIDILDAMGAADAALVGHSMGGAIAVEAALRAPDRVRRLTTIASVGFGAASVLPLVRAVAPAWIDPLLPHLVPRRMAAVVLRLAYGQPRFTARDIDEYWAPSQFPAFARVQRTLLHEFERAPGQLDDLRALRMPLLSICGTRDRFVRPASCGRFMRVAPRARVQMVPGAGHVVAEEQPDVVNAALLAFLAEDSSGVASQSGTN